MTVAAVAGLALTAVGAAPMAKAAPPRFGGLWLLDAGSGQTAKDSSSYHLDGTLGSSTDADANDPAWVAGATRSTKALRFSGDQFVQVPSAPSLQPQRITVGAVLRATGSPGPYKYIAAKGAFLCDFASYGLYTGPDGGLVFYVSDGTASYALSPDAGASVWDGRWHLVYGTYDGATVRLYVDGAQVGAGTPSTMAIGYDNPTDGRFFIGNYQGDCTTTLGFAGDIEAAGVLQDVVNWRPSSSS